MDKIRIRKLISSLAKRDYRRMYMNDFFLTWEKTSANTDRDTTLQSR